MKPSLKRSRQQQQQQYGIEVSINELKLNPFLTQPLKREMEKFISVDKDSEQPPQNLAKIEVVEWMKLQIIKEQE